MQGVVREIHKERFLLIAGIEIVNGRIRQFIGQKIPRLPVIEIRHIEGGKIFSLAFGLSPLPAANINIEAVIGRVVLIKIRLIDGHKVPFSQKESIVAAFL